MRKFITFEGGEGAGKTTQNRLLCQAFEQANIAAIHTREPGGSEGAEAIRALLVTGNATRWDAKTEVLLHFAARRDHIEKVITPALKQNTFVLCDRFIDSTVAYQHYGHGLPMEIIEFLSQHIIEDAFPALTFIFSVQQQEGMARAASRGDDENRYEQMGDNFHRRVNDGFLAIAKDNPGRCLLIDATQSIASIHAEIITTINRAYGLSLPLIDAKA